MTPVLYSCINVYTSTTYTNYNGLL